jgi:SSS family solute:Na+ symporter
VFEILDRAGGGQRYSSPLARWLIDLNFLHYAIVMFVICCGVLVLVSLVTSAPERSKLAGLTFATVQERIDLTKVEPVLLQDQYKPAPETATEHRVNLAFSFLLILSVVSLWIYFR